VAKQAHSAQSTATAFNEEGILETASNE